MSWQRLMPVWAHQQLWHLRQNWSGHDAPTGPILAAKQVIYPTKMLWDQRIPAIETCQVLVQAADGRAREYILWRDRPSFDIWGTDTEPVADNHPEDRITGYPDHYIVNGDPSGCGCAEHERLALAHLMGEYKEIEESIRWKEPRFPERRTRK